jgi:hypothetical protein
MKKTPTQMMKLINDKLVRYNQNIRIVSWSGKSIELSNGNILQDKKRSRFIKRVMTEKTDEWIKNIDKLLAGEILESDIKSKLSAIGGRAVQKKYEKIKNNLNTGIPWNKGMKGNYPYKFGPKPQGVKDKISKKNSGCNNGMFGIKMSEDQKNTRSDKMKQLILDGKFTPNTNNRNTHWNSEFNGKKYRSSWESLYQYLNPTASYETLRIEYFLGIKRKIYIVDFIDHINKTVIEVKPRELCTGEKFEMKMKSLTDWAIKNKYSVLLVDAEWLKSQIEFIEIDYSKFDNNTSKKIKSLYETNQKN